MGVCLLVGAVVVNVLAPARRGRLRTPVLLYVLYVGLAGVLMLARVLEYTPAMTWIDFLARVSAGFCATTLVVLGGVDVLLPRLGVRLPAIAGDVLSALGFGVVVVAVAASTGLTATSALAGGTIVAAALTISLQSTRGNVIGGVALQLDGTVQVGDWVQLEGGREGRVAAIRWRHLVVETRDGNAVMVPNASLLTTAITILGRRGGVGHPERRTVYFRLDRKHNPGHILGVVQDALDASPIRGTVPEPAPDCLLADLGKEVLDSSLLYAVRVWTHDFERDFVVDSEVRVRVHAALCRAGIELATPATTHINLDNEARTGLPVPDRERAYQVMRGVDLFGPLTEAECRQLAGALQFVPFAGGEYVIRQGRAARHLYILAAGTVEVRLEVNGSEQRVATLRAPDIFGEMGLLTGAPRTAGVVAVGPVECFKLDHEGFEAVLLSRPHVAGELAAVTAKRQAQLSVAREGHDARLGSDRSRETARILARMREFFGLAG